MQKSDKEKPAEPGGEGRGANVSVHKPVLHPDVSTRSMCCDDV